MPTNLIYQCNSCGRATWVPAGQSPAETAGDVIQQQEKSHEPDDDEPKS
jgi:hypothetical protein